MTSDQSFDDFLTFTARVVGRTRGFCLEGQAPSEATVCRETPTRAAWMKNRLGWTTVFDGSLNLDGVPLSIVDRLLAVRPVYEETPGNTPGLRGDRGGYPYWLCTVSFRRREECAVVRRPRLPAPGLEHRLEVYAPGRLRDVLSIGDDDGAAVTVRVPVHGSGTGAGCRLHASRRFSPVPPSGRRTS